MNIIEIQGYFLSLSSIVSIYEVNSSGRNLEVSVIISENLKVRFKRK